MRDFWQKNLKSSLHSSSRSRLWLFLLLLLNLLPPGMFVLPGVYSASMIPARDDPPAESNQQDFADASIEAGYSSSYLLPAANIDGHSQLQAFWRFPVQSRKLSDEKKAVSHLEESAHHDHENGGLWRRMLASNNPATTPPLTYSNDTVLRASTVLSMDRFVKKADAMFRVFRHEKSKQTSGEAADIAILYTLFSSTQNAAANLLVQNRTDYGVLAANPVVLVPSYNSPRYADLRVLPIALASVAPAYNLPGFTERLVLSRTVLAQIFLGDITFWNDPAIRATNPGATLPNQRIVLIVDGTSTLVNTIFTEALALFLPAFAARIPPKGTPNWCENALISTSPAFLGRSVSLCRKSVQGRVDLNYTSASGAEGVSVAVKATPYSLAYIFFGEGLFRNVSMASMINKHNDIVHPGIDAVKNAFLSVDDYIDDTWNISMNDSPALGSWPIVSLNLFVYRTMTHTGNCQSRQVLADYFEWFYFSSDVQNLLARSGLAPLADNFRERAVTQMRASLKCVANCFGTLSTPCSCLQDPSKCLSVQATGLTTNTVQLYFDTSLEPLLNPFIEGFRGTNPGFEVKPMSNPIAPTQMLSLPLTTIFATVPDFHAGIVPAFLVTSLLSNGSSAGSYGELKAEATNFASVPLFQSPLGIIFNIGSVVTSLNLSIEAVSKILRGNILRWNHTDIRALNPAVANLLPNTPIVLVVEANNPLTVLFIHDFLVKYCGPSCGLLDIALGSNATVIDIFNPGSSTATLGQAETLLGTVVSTLVKAWRALGMIVVAHSTLTDVIAEIRSDVGTFSITFIGGQSGVNTASLMINNMTFTLGGTQDAEAQNATYSLPPLDILSPVHLANKHIGYVATAADGAAIGGLQPGIWPLSVPYAAVVRTEFKDTAQPLSLDTARNILAFFKFLVSDDISWKLARTMQVDKPKYSDVGKTFELLSRVRYENRSVMDPEPLCSLSFMNVTFSECSPSTETRLAHFFWNTKPGPYGDPACVGNENSLFQNKELPCDFLDLNSPLGYGLVCVVVISALICSILLMWVFYRRNAKSILSSQPLFLYLFIIGAIVFLLASLSILGENSKTSCLIRPAVLGIGFTQMFAPLLMKLQRVDALFNNAKLRKIVITNRQVLFKIFSFLVVDAVILGLWYGLEPPHLEIGFREFTQIPGSSIPRRTCIYTDSKGFYVYLIWKVLIALMGVVLAIKTWNVSHEYSEAKFLAIALFISLTFSGVAALVLATVDLSGPQQVMVLLLMCTFVGLISVVLLVVPKMLKVSNYLGGEDNSTAVARPIAPMSTGSGPMTAKCATNDLRSPSVADLRVFEDRQSSPIMRATNGGRSNRIMDGGDSKCGSQKVMAPIMETSDAFNRPSLTTASSTQQTTITSETMAASPLVIKRHSLVHSSSSQVGAGSPRSSAGNGQEERK